MRQCSTNLSGADQCYFGSCHRSSPVSVLFRIRLLLSDKISKCAALQRKIAFVLSLVQKVEPLGSRP